MELTVADVKAVLERYLRGDIDADECSAWADALEMRDDVDFENNAVNEAVFELANPSINGPLTRVSARELLASL